MMVARKATEVALAEVKVEAVIKSGGDAEGGGSGDKYGSDLLTHTKMRDWNETYICIYRQLTI